MTARRRAMVIVGVGIVATAAVVVATLVFLPSGGPVVAKPWRSHFRLATSATDPISPNSDNYASRTRPASPLLLFLAATGHRPSDYRSFLSVARSSGYHVLALDYWNTGLSVQKMCRTDPRCYGQVQRNRLDGSRPSSFSSVGRSNSIVNRLSVALDRLRKRDPNGGWNRYVGPGGIRWNRIVVAGHSQGGGEAAYIAHVHRVRGAVMFSSPVDSYDGLDAAWMARPGATAPSRLYGFVDTGDMFYRRVLASWAALGMSQFGAPVSPGRLGSEGARSEAPHEIVTTRDLGGPDASHLRDITDRTPRAADGTPVFARTWSWLLSQLYTAPGSTDTWKSIRTS